MKASGENASFERPTRSPRRFVEDMFEPVLEPWAQGRDRAMEAVIDGYADEDWSSEFAPLGRLPDTAPVVTFFADFASAIAGQEAPVDVVGRALAVLHRFRAEAPACPVEAYVGSLAATLAICHVGYLWHTRARVHDEDGVDDVSYTAWMALVEAGSLLDAPRSEEAEREVKLLLQIGESLYRLNKDMRMSMLIHPFFQLPALVDHWGESGSFLDLCPVNQVPDVMLGRRTRRQRVLQMLGHLSRRVHPELFPFIEAVQVPAELPSEEL
ncbi:hypothetical protein MSAN_02293100 [Mycena sanguinolenta]|uniref:Uncharacterized protein n=1 Tax=Mycena sanguinolenta TaxID=230812 RepID=A0A8H7CGB2_9AGAR|nr:hypothetical protein MSAN_02293100 [Mycena sanguinolenta]